MTKSLSLALSVAKKAKAKGSTGEDEVRRARLHDLLFGIGGEGEAIDLTPPDEGVETEEPAEKPSRSDRLKRILAQNGPKIDKT